MRIYGSAEDPLHPPDPCVRACVYADTSINLTVDQPCKATVEADKDAFTNGINYPYECTFLIKLNFQFKRTSTGKISTWTICFASYKYVILISLTEIRKTRVIWSSLVLSLPIWSSREVLTIELQRSCDKRFAIYYLLLISQYPFCGK